MRFNDLTGVEGIAIVPNLVISPDSYIRLTFERFRKLTLVHFISGLDEDEPALVLKGAVTTDITGYTEWVSETAPTISIGWDWMMQPDRAKDCFYKRISGPRSNLMLIDAQQRDIGSAKTAVLIEAVIDEMAWQKIIEQYISNRYI